MHLRVCLIIPLLLRRVRTSPAPADELHAAFWYVQNFSYTVHDPKVQTPEERPAG